MTLLDRLEPGARAYMERLSREGGKPLPQLAVDAASQYMRDSQSDAAGTFVDVDLNGGHCGRYIDNCAACTGLLASSCGALYAWRWMGAGRYRDACAHRARGGIARRSGRGVPSLCAVPRGTLSSRGRSVLRGGTLGTGAWIRTRNRRKPDGGGGRQCGRQSGCGCGIAHGAAWRPRSATAGTDVSRHFRRRLERVAIEEFAEGLNLTREAMEWFWSQVRADPALRYQLMASPLQAPLAGLRRSLRQ